MSSISSGWLEYLDAGTKADQFGVYLESPENILLPSIVVYEVYKKLFREAGKELFFFRRLTDFTGG